MPDALLLRSQIIPHDSTLVLHTMPATKGLENVLFQKSLSQTGFPFRRLTSVQTVMVLPLLAKKRSQCHESSHHRVDTSSDLIDDLVCIEATQSRKKF